MTFSIRTGVAAISLAVLTACTPVKNPDPQDPMESFNRSVFAFNQVADEFVLEPLARGYRFITPQVARDSVSNFFGNLREPVTFANAVLQGESEIAFASFWRFVINSTIGLGGLIDVADSSTELKKHEEDFGQTLASWGWTDASYLMLPILGPSTTRDALGKVPDYYAHPATYYLENPEHYVYMGASGLSTREGLLAVTDDVKENSLDPYATYRSLYLQKRANDIANKAASSAK